MALTQLDKVTALVLIDLQKGIVSLPVAHPAAQIVSQSVRLARAFREKQLPVVLVNVADAPIGRMEGGPRTHTFAADWAELVPELERQPSDHLTTKVSFGAFIGTDLDNYLRRRGATQIVLAGIATSIGVESTARSALDLGYNIAFAVDAMTDITAENHRHSIEKVFPRLGEQGTTEDVLKLLNERRA